MVCRRCKFQFTKDMGMPWLCTVCDAPTCDWCLADDPLPMRTTSCCPSKAEASWFYCGSCINFRKKPRRDKQRFDVTANWALLLYIFVLFPAIAYAQFTLINRNIAKKSEVIEGTCADMRNLDPFATGGEHVKQMPLYPPVDGNDKGMFYG